jgi:glycosyltransferase involved in cell wall biosynthesis
MNRYNVLASVYACNPYDGSERAVGWNWICEIDKFHNVWAITSSVYKADIEDYKNKNPGALQNTKFIYIKVPKLISLWHKGYRGERLYYILWQKAAFKHCKKLMEKANFDLVHHITYVTCVLPTYMHKLGLPFLYGPVAGGENIPKVIRFPNNRKDDMVERVRISVQKFFSLTPNFSRTMKGASVILATTNETKQLIPEKYREKVNIFQAIGLNEKIFYPEPLEKKNHSCRFLIAGRMIYWKGYELAILAFKQALERGCDAELTILGDTDDGDLSYKEYLRRICGHYIDKEIKFVSKVDYTKMKEFYDGFDVLINGSFRDSGCFIVMEAQARGIPVICVDTGGPAVNTTENTSIKIQPAPLNQMITDMAGAINKLAKDRKLREKMSKAAREYAISHLNMCRKMESINQFYDIAIKKAKKNKVCMVVQNPMVKGGIASVVNGYRESELEKRFDITYVESYKDGSRLSKLMKGISGYIKFIKVLIKDKPEVIHIHSSFGPSFYRKIPFIIMASWARKSIINHVHGAEFKDFYENANTKKRKLIEKIYNKCSCIIALSDEWKDKLSKIVPNEKIVVIENYSVIYPKATEERLKRVCNNQVLFLGAIGKRKGCYDIPEVVERVAKEVPDVKFVIGGSGDIEQITEILRNKGIEKYVEFSGWVRGKDRDSLFRESDIFFLPSYNEGMPMSILDAMGYGLPIVSTDVGGIPKIVHQGENGYLCEAGDCEEFASRIIEILKNADLRSKYILGSFNIAKADYSLEAHLIKIIQKYKEVLASK